MKKIYDMPKIIKILFRAVLILAAAYLIARFITTKTVVDGVSMYPTLENGEQLLIDRLAYRLWDPERFDIIVFSEDDSNTGYYIKRIIGLPGEEVTIDKKGNIYINGRVLRDRYGYGVISNPGLAVKTVTVGEDEYFVLGDNRNYSTDSRFKEVGNVKREQITGRTNLRVWPLRKFGYIDLYMERKAD